ncbi:MAG: hypothetical protein GYB25_08410 [Rhodobacteraceae bacterium]|nr:hypothetical protein [Paracoccaceae bacterium]
MSILSGKEVTYFSALSVEYCALLRKRCFAGAAWGAAVGAEPNLAGVACASGLGGRNLRRNPSLWEKLQLWSDAHAVFAKLSPGECGKLILKTTGMLP